MEKNDIKNEIRKYIIETIVQGNVDGIKNDTLLISGGIMDSISTLKLVNFLEEKFAIEFHPHEVDRENLDSIDLIADFVESKLL
jgi:acyl carrier protein